MSITAIKAYHINCDNMIDDKCYEDCGDCLADSKEEIIDYLKSKGWKISNNGKKALCPTCAKDKTRGRE